ncbi:MAG TPA: polysaccharide deacetylase family protein, partial [Gemmatimonadaceae bacterium]|nr:polysaccharide deacetylase family protein [Gemmatimonadaceae bacterium]
MKWFVRVALTCAVTALAADTMAAQVRQPGTTWSDEQLRRAVAPARAGRRLTPKTWPNGARVAVSITFDDDNESYLLAAGDTSPTSLSAGEFGARSGLPRILRLLDRYQVPSTFFIPAVSAMLHPEMIPAILQSGRHEIGVHGWIHEYPPALGSAEEEERLLTKAIDYLTAQVGKRPVGYRAPAWAFSPHTLSLVRKAGFLYESSLQAMDEPYEVLAHGQPTGLVELGIDWTLTETPYLGARGSMPSPEQVFRLFREE